MHARCIQGLEQAIACLNEEHEKVEAQKVAVADLMDKGCSEETAKPLLVYDMYQALDGTACIRTTQDPKLNLI